jgi:hypothetical protein
LRHWAHGSVAGGLLPPGKVRAGVRLKHGTGFPWSASP